jgi:hypothetical protein
VAEVEPGWSSGGLGPVHDSGESASGPEGVLGMEVAMDQRLTASRGYCGTAAAACCQTFVLVNQRGRVASALS